MSLLGLEAKVLDKNEIGFLSKEFRIYKRILRAVRKREFYDSYPECGERRPFTKDVYEVMSRDSSGFYITYCHKVFHDGVNHNPYYEDEKKPEFVNYPIDQIFRDEETEEKFFEIIRRNIIERNDLNGFERYWKMRKNLYLKLLSSENSVKEINRLRKESFSDYLGRIFSVSTIYDSVGFIGIGGLIGFGLGNLRRGAAIGMFLPVFYRLFAQNPLWLIRKHAKNYYHNLDTINRLFEDYVKNSGV
ncbi:hypothetical protein HYX17_04485 [Candidatus Woesearchaeota archaeon]|nr:hypothetical protein [Candidatus Woesearchaeota archaeon]